MKSNTSHINNYFRNFLFVMSGNQIDNYSAIGNYLIFVSYRSDISLFLEKRRGPDPPFLEVNYPIGILI